MGRKKAVIDWRRVDKLLEAGCNGVEISANLGIHSNTLYERCKVDNKCDFSDYAATKRASGDSLLRTAQFKAAMAGDKSMLIWLGKQRLNQTDKKDTNLSGDLAVRNTGEVVLYLPDNGRDAND